MPTKLNNVRSRSTDVSSHMMSIVAAFKRYITSPTEEWVRPRTLRGRDATYAKFLLERMEAVFCASVHQREWFFAVEWALSIIGGVILGSALTVAALSVDGDPCVTMQWPGACSIALGAVHFMLTVFLQPNNVRIELWVAIALDVLGIIGEAFALADEADAARVVLIVSSLLELATITVLMLSFGLSWGGQPNPGTTATQHSTESSQEILLAELPLRSGCHSPVINSISCMMSSG